MVSLIKALNNLRENRPVLIWHFALIEYYPDGSVKIVKSFSRPAKENYNLKTTKKTKKSTSKTIYGKDQTKVEIKEGGELF